MIAVHPLARVLRTLAGAGFTALLVAAPLNFGSTRPGGAVIIAFGCAGASGLWLASLLAARRRPSVPAVAAWTIGLFVLAALPWLTGLAEATSIEPFTQIHFARVVARWPVSILSLSRTEATWLMLALVTAALPLIDLARERRWSRAFTAALVGTAVIVAVLSLLQNATAATGIYWSNHGRMPGTFCGTFFHHTSAGAYFNTAWPLAVTATWLAWRGRPHTAGSRLLTAAGLLAVVVLLAAHGGHVSRFPQFAALLVTPFLVLAVGIRLRGPRPWLYGAAGATAIALLVLIGGRGDFIGARWRVLFHPVVTPLIQPAEADWLRLIRDDMVIPFTSHPGWFGDRTYGWRAACDAIAARPFTGHGPGNWIGAASQHSDDPFVRTFYQFLQFAHQDALQTAVEWGIPAALAVWTFLFGAVIATVRQRYRHRGPPMDEAHTLALAAACGLAAVLLQAQLDFPLQIPAVAFNVVVLASLCWAAACPRHSAPPPAA